MLNTGSYMIVSKVINFLETKTFKFTASSIVKKICKVHKDENGIEWYSTKDLIAIIAPQLYRSMECSVVTYIFNPKFDKAPINPQAQTK